MKRNFFARRSAAVVGIASFCVALQGCASLSASGPSAGAIAKSNGELLDGGQIAVVEPDADTVRTMLAAERQQSFADALGEGAAVETLLTPGDIITVIIWEAPPAALFGGGGSLTELTQGSVDVARGTNLPEQMIETDGRISVPFIGQVRAAGRTPSQVAADIKQRLDGLAHQPQVFVRVAGNAGRTVTVIGDSGGGARVPLTSKGERLLDVIAAIGGTKQPVNKTTVEITRAGRAVAMPLRAVIEDPRQNVRLSPNDVVTTYYKPFSFTALGAVGASSELEFEATGITLAQALARVGGLQDARSSPRGVFIFRLERPDRISSSIGVSGGRATVEGLIPVVYRFDLSKPTQIFLAQSFPVHDKDMLYVTNAPTADLQKFLNLLSSVTVPILTVNTITN